MHGPQEYGMGDAIGVLHERMRGTTALSKEQYECMHDCSVACLYTTITCKSGRGGCTTVWHGSMHNVV